MDSQDDGPIDEDGILWQGSREELEAWKRRKQEWAARFVHRGYSVEWTPDGSNWLGVYQPERDYAGKPELRADIKFYAEPSPFGIGGGRISKLGIFSRRTSMIAKVLGRPFESTRVFYNYDRGLDVDRLQESADARRLFSTVIEELN